MFKGKTPPPSATRQALGRLGRLEAQSQQRNPLTFALGKMVSTSGNHLSQLFEMVALTVITILISMWVNPDNPLWIEASFPWTWFAPVILALRYGPLSGLGGAGMILVAWLLLNNGEVDYSTFPKMSFLGGLILVMLVGEFSSVWFAKHRRAETLQVYLEHRLDYLTRQYYLLRLSHDRLEQDLISRPMSMRDALKTLQGIGTASNLASSADVLLRLVAQYCQIESAVVLGVDGERIAPQPVATLGTPGAVRADDPLIRQAFASAKLCHVSQTLTEDNAALSTRYLIAAPLVNFNDELFGLLVVEEMPFFALQEETLQTLNLLLGYYTDGLAVMTLAQPLTEEFADCPNEFAFELQRLWHIRQQSEVTSVLVALEMDERALARDLPQQIIRIKRQLDENWLVKAPKRQLVVTLMPLADASTAEGYLARLEGWIKQHSGGTLADAGIYSHVLLVDEEPPRQLVRKLLDIAHA